jgi:hypothetical protein
MRTRYGLPGLPVIGFGSVRFVVLGSVQFVLPPLGLVRFANSELAFPRSTVPVPQTAAVRLLAPRRRLAFEPRTHGPFIDLLSSLGTRFSLCSNRSRIRIARKICLVIAETSCEARNLFLDRALLVDTVGPSGVGFF